MPAKKLRQIVGSTMKSTRKCARISRFRGTGCDISSSIVPRSISPATAPAARPTAHTTHSVSTIGCSIPIARKSLGYLLHGPREALDVIAEITGSPRTNIAALCLGGTLTTMLLAHLAHHGDDRVRSATLLNTLIDFGEPGMLGSFTDPDSVRRLARRMAASGVLEGADMALTFDLLRANDLIWNYVASGWLMGEDPPAFDILAWNADSTRMPAAMHSFYLEHCYGENELARGEMELAGAPLQLDRIAADIYLLAAKEDHIVPWTSAYKATQLFTGAVRYVLSSSGHIAGIVNPPNPKARHWTGDALPADPQAWLADATQHDDSWWHDWVAWIGERAGSRREPPLMGSDAHPPLGPAPGTYVHER